MLRRVQIQQENAATTRSTWSYQGFRIKRLDLIKRLECSRAMAFNDGIIFVVVDKNDNVEFECDTIVEALDNIDTYETGSSFTYKGHSIIYRKREDVYTVTTERKKHNIKNGSGVFCFRSIISVKRYVDLLRGECTEQEYAQEHMPAQEWPIAIKMEG